MKIASNRSRPLSRLVRSDSPAIASPQRMWRGVVPVLAAGLVLAGCATSPSSSSGHASAQDLLALNNIQDASGINKRDLTSEEKQVISHAVGLSVANPNA